MSSPSSHPSTPSWDAPPTQALGAALRAIIRRLPPCPTTSSPQTAGQFTEAVDRVLSEVSTSALRHSRHRYDGHPPGVAREFTAAVIQATRWADELAGMLPNPDSVPPHPVVHTALVAALAQRLVIDGPRVAAHAHSACRRAVTRLQQATATSADAGPRARAS